MSREVLHSLIDVVDEKEIDTVYRILLKFVAEDAVALDEAEAIEQAGKDKKKGDLFSHTEAWS